MTTTAAGEHLQDLELLRLLLVILLQAGVVTRRTQSL